MTPRHKRLMLAAIVLGGTAVAVALVVNAFRSNLVFFYSPTDVLTQHAPKDRTFRLGGLVEAGSVKRQPDGVTVRFVVTDTAKTIPVEYRGILPDLFKEGKGVVAQGKLRADFSVTLSVHNASETRPLVLRRIAYFDTSGKMVESYLKAPIALKPFSTVEVFIPTSDVRGGTGANFVVDWAAAGEIAEPAVEALMVGGVGAGHYAFISQGRPVRLVGKN